MKHLQFGERITVVPVVHGSGDFAVEVRRLLLSDQFDCLAVPLPRCFQEPVETAIANLPEISVVWQREDILPDVHAWTPEDDLREDLEEEAEPAPATYVPIDPCQPVIAALRIALQEHLPRYFIDAEVARFEPVSAALPDPYAAKSLHGSRFATAILPVLPEVDTPQMRERAACMVAQLRELQLSHKRILCLCSFSEWLPLRRAWLNGTSAEISGTGPDAPVQLSRAETRSLLFLLGELPYITGLYEQARYELDDDENLSIDGIKQLLLSARKRYREEHGQQARPITTKLLGIYFRYIRNLALIERRLTPDLYTLVVAARQIFGDQFAIALAEQARDYPFPVTEAPTLHMGIGHARLPEGDIVTMKSRLPGHPLAWRECQLQSRPPRIDQERWQSHWNPFAHCSWPPEDVAIERFRSHVKDHALQLLGNDLARVEKFTSSLKDGLDIRETLRNWHTGELYVKEFPPTRGSLDCVIMLFDSPADPRDYPWRITWHAEHNDESTLAFFATNFLDCMVGPGIAQGQYGGAMFLFPPRDIPDIWTNKRFDFVDTLEERLIVAGCHYSREKHVALLSEAPPGVAWRKLAQRAGRKLIHVPLKRFSQQTVQQLRMFHILNGQEVRSFAAHFIRKT
ncbi:MAG: hypothetical protein R3C12_06310 [Planctomycetaceae bacterium]|nr:hypothetical protein [Planctomycetaceae bacterium]